MARQMSAQSVLDDVTECSICTEVFTDPRGLPCMHMFCLKCLLNYGKDRQPGDTMPCPLCRTEFTIPDDGLAGIQKNFFMQKLLHARKLPSAKEAHHIACDACSSNKASADDTDKPATMHCVKCAQNYCDQCSRSHARVKGTAGHVQTGIGEPLQQEELVAKLPAATCEVHKGEEIKVYCLECKVAICVMCLIKSHKSHNCSDIEEVSPDLRRQAISDTDKVTGDINKTEALLCGFDKEKKDLIQKLADVEIENNETADKWISAFQRDRTKLLSEVESIRQKRFKELETVRQEVEHHMAALESFKRYIETLLSSGTACDVMRSAKSLHDRADELINFDVTGHVESSLPRVTVKFAQSSIVSKQVDNFVGDIIEEEKSRRVPRVTRVIPASTNVGGVTSLGDDVYVVRDNTPHVEVYDAVTFTLRRRLQVPGLERPRGLAACVVNKCLYASDNDNQSVHRVELSGSNAVMKWSVARSPVGQSVNSARNVLVVSCHEHKLQEFTTRGRLVREIQLQADLELPRHAVQLSADKFLVTSHCRPVHRACMVDAKGSVVRSYGGPKGSDLNYPNGLSVDKHGNVLVADLNNNRLLVLDASLSSAHEMSVSVDGGLQRPFSLCHDESRRRLYVGELGGGRVIVIDNVTDFSTSQV